MIVERATALLTICAVAVAVTALSLSALVRAERRSQSAPAELETAAAVLAELPEPRLVTVEQSVERGQAATVVLHPGLGVRGMQVALEDPDGEEISNASGFRVYPVRDVAVWIAKLGVPNTAEDGAYTLRASALYDDGSREFQTALEVEHTEFYSMEIALSPAMTDLRREPDPERIRQAREMAALLSSYRLDGLYYEGAFEPPVSYRRRSAGYGDRRVYRYHDGDSATAVHVGVDMAAPSGEPVYAAAGGRVAFADDRIISGYSVVLEHLPGVYSLYYHLDEITVEEGEVLRPGSQIGTVGATGLATGPHLHWELRVGGVPVDPDRYLERPLVDKVAIFSTILDILKARDENVAAEHERG